MAGKNASDPWPINAVDRLKGAFDDNLAIGLQRKRVYSEKVRIDIREPPAFHIAPEPEIESAAWQQPGQVDSGERVEIAERATHDDLAVWLNHKRSDPPVRTGTRVKPGIQYAC